jgi:hypothetical protein
MYKFLNINPLNKKEEDCVNRAISLALCKDYYVIRNKLYLIADLFDCDTLCVCCYKHLLDDVYQLPRIDMKGYTIKEFIRKYPKGTFIIRVDGHLTCVINGKCYDIWDCTDEVIDIVWEAI